VKLHSVTRTLIACFIASGAAAFAVILVFRDFRPLVTESFLVSFCLSTPIAFVSRFLVPPVMQRIGLSGWKLTAALSVVLAVSAAIGSLLGTTLLLVIGLVLPQQFWANYYFFVRITAAMVIVSGLVSRFHERMTSQLRQTQLDKERAQKAELEAKLSALESRIHPHFLFNTLNSISALISRDPKKAEEMLGRLSSLLRNSLNSTREGLIPLESELRIVDDYLEIQKARLGDRLAFSFEVHDGVGRFLVPPFSVQSIVENAVKHGIAPKEDGGRVEIMAERNANLLRVDVRDTGEGFSLADMAAGHGLDNLISRLDTLFGSAASLQVGRDGKCCVVSLRIPV
jgi:two-component system, LytTR family, sensor histidine kinase AlgZ